MKIDIQKESHFMKLNRHWKEKFYDGFYFFLIQSYVKNKVYFCN